MVIASGRCFSRFTSAGDSPVNGSIVAASGVSLGVTCGAGFVPFSCMVACGVTGIMLDVGVPFAGFASGEVGRPLAGLPLGDAVHAHRTNINTNRWNLIRRGCFCMTGIVPKANDKSLIFLAFFPSLPFPIHYFPFPLARLPSTVFRQAITRPPSTVYRPAIIHEPFPISQLPSFIIPPSSFILHTS